MSSIALFFSLVFFFSSLQPFQVLKVFLIPASYPSTFIVCNIQSNFIVSLSIILIRHLFHCFYLPCHTPLNSNTPQSRVSHFLLFSFLPLCIGMLLSFVIMNFMLATYFLSPSLSFPNANSKICLLLSLWRQSGWLNRLETEFN